MHSKTFCPLQPADFADSSPALSASLREYILVIAPQVPLSMMAFANKPRESGTNSCKQVLAPPADSPKIVTLFGSPPKAEIFLLTHFSAIISRTGVHTGEREKAE